MRRHSAAPCYEVCPVKINIPEVLIHLRGEVVRQKQERSALSHWPDSENMAMRFLAGVFADPSKFERFQKLGRFGQRFFTRSGAIERLPGPFGGWTAMRDVVPVANQTFREWWRTRT